MQHSDVPVSQRGMQKLSVYIQVKFALRSSFYLRSKARWISSILSVQLACSKIKLYVSASAIYMVPSVNKQQYNNVQCQHVQSKQLYIWSMTYSHSKGIAGNCWFCVCIQSSNCRNDRYRCFSSQAIQTEASTSWWAETIWSKRGFSKGAVSQSGILSRTLHVYTTPVPLRMRSSGALSKV